MTEGTYLLTLGATGAVIGYASTHLAWPRRLAVVVAVCLAISIAYKHGFNRGLDTVEQAVERALQDRGDPDAERIETPEPRTVVKPRLVV